MKTAHRCMLAVALFGPMFLAWIYFVLLAPPAKGSPGFGALLAYGLSKTAQFSLPIAWVLYVERQKLKTLGFTSRGMATGAAFGLVVIALTLGAYFAILRHSPMLRDTPEKVLAKISAFHIGTPARYMLMCLFIAGIHSFLEEYYWRWFVFGELRRDMETASAIVLASFAFMLHHVVILAVYFPNKFWQAALPFSLAVAIGGAFWCWLYQRSGNIMACWLSHVLADLAIMAVGYDMVFVK